LGGGSALALEAHAQFGEREPGALRGLERGEQGAAHRHRREVGRLGGGAEDGVGDVPTADASIRRR
jgi:hypothetical protein